MKKSVLILVILLSPPLWAENVEPRTKHPSTETRVRGADTLQTVPGGWVALGSSALRHLPAGAKQWKTLHRLPGKALYRVASDDLGRLLASWEYEDNLYLIQTGTGEVKSFPKPKRPSEKFHTWSLDDLFFTKEGDALVYMHGMTGSCTYTTAAFLYPLKEGARPLELFQQAGHSLYTSPLLSVFAYSNNERFPCDDNGCRPLSGIAAYEVLGKKAVRKHLMTAQGEEWSGAKLVWGSRDDGFAAVLRTRKNVRHLLRYAYGKGGPDLRPLPKGSNWTPEWTWLTREGDLLQVWNDAPGLLIERFPIKGQVSKRKVKPGGPKADRDTRIHTLKERKNGDLILHWGNRLFLLSPGKKDRWVDLEHLLKRRSEWAGADIYAQEPEGLWVGVEVGSGRDFIHLRFEEIEKNAKILD